MAELIIGPALALGLIIGVYELIVVHRDVDKAFARSMHGTQAIITSIIFTFVSMNADFVYTAAPVFQSIPLGPLGLQIAAGLIAAVKIHGANQTKGLSSGSGVKAGETWFHSILVGALIVAAPYVYPIVEPMLPDWVKF
ncbi:hypothetical protein J4219_08765 [Candidatus Woesearchaeota archaeon]|nr:hypothetical protein [Candidatus Woesearchaeota archaeon]